MDAGPTARPSYLSQFREVDFEGLGILVKPESDHGVKDVFTSYSFAFLDEAFLCSLARNEAYEL